MTTRTDIATSLKEVMATKGVHLNAQQSNQAVSTVFQAIKNALVNDGEVRIDGFGTLKRKDVTERKGHNPATGEPIVIPAHKAIVFKAGKLLNDSINA